MQECAGRAFILPINIFLNELLISQTNEIPISKVAGI
jgi:hypothetical protein